jgi:geranylgeranyl diphosphate synthase type I
MYMAQSSNGLSRFNVDVDSAMAEIFHQSADSSIPLYKMLEYQLGWSDKLGVPHDQKRDHRTMGSLCLAAGETFGSNPPWIPFVAGAIELLHQSIVVHEEMQIATPAVVGQREPVWWIWGPAQAINVGDSLYALARLSIFNINQLVNDPKIILDLIREIDSAALRFYEGQYCELVYQERLRLTTQDYFTTIKSKYGFAVALPLALTALACNQGPSRVDAIRDFGTLIGAARHIMEEIQIIWTDVHDPNRIGSLLNKTKPLPAVHIFEKGTIGQKKLLGEIYFKRVLESSDLTNLRNVLDNTPAREYSETEVQKLIGQADNVLKSAGFVDRELKKWRSLGQLILRI